MHEHLTITIAIDEKTLAFMERLFGSRDSKNNQRIFAKLEEINLKLDKIIRREKQVSKELDALRAQVEANTAVDQSAITLLEGLSAKIEALKDDPAALQALADSLSADSARLAAAVSANTPAEAPPTP